MSVARQSLLDLLPEMLTGDTVRVEHLHERHAEGLLAIGGDASIWQHLSRGPLTSLDDARAFIHAAGAQNPEYGLQHAFAVIDLKSNRIAGSTRYLAIRPSQRGLEIGWTWYGTEFQRTHVNTACKLLLLTHAFETMGCIRVEFKTDKRNERSQRAIERIGAKREGVLRNHHIRPDGSFRDSVYYSITNEEWHDVKARLNQVATSWRGRCPQPKR